MNVVIGALVFKALLKSRSSYHQQNSFSHDERPVYGGKRWHSYFSHNAPGTPLDQLSLLTTVNGHQLGLCQCK